MRRTPWDGNETTANKPVSGRLVEQYIKSIDDKTETTDDVTSGETKAARAGAVADAMTGMLTDIDVKDSDDGTQYVMSFKRRKGDGTDEDGEVRFSKYTDDDKVVVSVSLTDGGGSPLPSSQYRALGSRFVVRYSAAVGTAGGGTVDGYGNLRARVIVKRGNTVLSAFRDAEFTNVAAGQEYTFDASPYLTDASAYTVQVEAQADYDGATLARTAAARVTMVAMTLESTFDVSNGLADGGYNNDVTVPFTLAGTTGEKNLYYRLNGGSVFTLLLSTGSGTQSRNIVIGLGDMQGGRNVLEVYAKHEPSGVISEVFYITLLKAASGLTSYAGVMFRHKADGFQSEYGAPVMNAEQFTAWSFDYAGYAASSPRAAVRVVQGGSMVKEDSLPRTEKGSYGRTNVLTDTLPYTVMCGSSALGLTVHTSGHGDIEASLASDAVCSFDAYGRSNTESDAAVWRSGGLEMRFENVLWQVNGNGAGSGWHNGRLLLSNGASMRLTKPGGHYWPFNDGEKPAGQAIGDVGMTVEMEFSTANVTDTGAELITCLGTLSNGNRYGLVVTPEEVKFLTGVVTTAEDAGETISYEDSVGTKFEPNTSIKIAYTFYPDVSTNGQRGLIGFYVNGVESASSRWTGKVSFDIQSELVFNSAGADLLVKNVRIYDKALTDDEALDNYIVDRNHLEDTAEEKGVRTLDEANRVLDEGGRVSLQKLLGLMPKRRNSALVFIGTGSVESEVPSASDTMNVLDALAQLNDKKANKMAGKVIFHNGEHPEQSFIAENVFVRIQGTSSVNYSRKNWRIYFQKTGSGHTASLSYGEMDSNGVQKNPVRTEGKKNLFRLRPESVGVKLACPKCDFSDSSMTTNTGGAKFFTDGMKEMGLLTPAQAYARDHDLDDDYRASIDGMPCDLFAARTEDEDLTYYGQYNMNNDKSESYPVFGQDKTIGGETWGEGGTLDYLTADEDGHKEFLPIAIETLNNSNPCCLFQWVPSTDAAHASFMDRHFDGGLELNHPKDTFWNSGKGDAAEEPNMKEHIGTGDRYDRMYKAIDRLMSFINRCVKETAAGRNVSYNTDSGAFSGVDYADNGDKFPSDKWQSAYFKAHAAEYMNVPYAMAYYMFVDFNLGVDQFAKNILWRTWDGRMWYPTWYDGDCQHGNDNTSMLTGRYDDNRQTKRNGAYVMQGHDSWLWNLLVANFSGLRETLMTTGVNGGASFRSAFSVQKALNYFNTEQMDRWCERLYNKSGIFKYIFPFLNALPAGSGGTMQTYPQIYGMKGSLKAHRGYFISRRYDLKQVEYGYVPTSGAQLYQSTSSQNAGHILAPVTFALTVPYRVQISTANGVQADSGVVAADGRHTLALTGAFNENDPLKIAGAEKIRELVWHEDAFALGFNFGLFTSLVRLDMSVASPGAYRNASYMAGTGNMALLEELVMTNNRMARNGDGGSVATLDLSRQGRLRKALLKGTGIETLTLAPGAPVEELALPETLTGLFLENLTMLDESRLELEGVDNVTGYRFDNCPGIDGFAILERLHEAKAAGTGRLERFCIEVDMEDDGTLLERYAGYGTYTPDGANDNRHSGLRGTVRMTRCLGDAELERYKGVYPELDIIQPAYTVIVLADEVADGANVSNLDNGTGYEYDTDYVPSGHVARIFAARYRCLAKKTADGEVTVCRLHDNNSMYFHDGTAAELTGEMGDVMMYEPHYWYKGVNDFLNRRKYSVFSADDGCPEPSGESVRVARGEMTVRGGYAVSAGASHATVSEAESPVSGASCYTVAVEGYRQVRWPSVAHDEYGAVMVDAGGNIVKRMAAGADCGMLDGMYCFTDIPEGAVSLVFTVLNSAPFDYVLLTKSDKVEAVEPDWVEHEECLTGVFEAGVSGGGLRSISGVKPSDGSWDDFNTLAGNRGGGYRMMDYEMHKDVCNLFYAKYGSRDSRGTCGRGSSSNDRTTGRTGGIGMNDTFANPDNPTENSAYLVIGGVAKDLASPNVMGYENWHGNKAEWMMLRWNLGAVDYKWRSPMPDGTVREIQGPRKTGDLYPRTVLHGRYMDTLVAMAGGSASSHYYGNCHQTASRDGVGCRLYNAQYNVGGMSAVFTGYGTTSVVTYIGSRLAFRGVIKRAASVAAFKDIAI